MPFFTRYSISSIPKPKTAYPLGHIDLSKGKYWMFRSGLWMCVNGKLLVYLGSILIQKRKSIWLQHSVRHQGQFGPLVFWPQGGRTTESIVWIAVKSPYLIAAHVFFKFEKNSEFSTILHELITRVFLITVQVNILCIAY